MDRLVGRGPSVPYTGVRADPPSPLGDGERLLENVGDLQVAQVRAVEAPGVTHIKYRVVKDLRGRST